MRRKAYASSAETTTTANNQSVPVQSSFPLKGDNFRTVAHIKSDKDLADFKEALGIYSDIQQCLEIAKKSR